MKNSDKEKHYQYLANIMKKGQVDTIEKAEQHIQGLKQKTIRFSLTVLAIAIVLYLFIPKYIFFILMLTLFGLAWAWSSTYTTQQMIRRYIKLELSEK